MKTGIISLIGLFLFSCGTKKTTAISDKTALFEVIKQDEFGGATIQFYEIISEPNEFKLLLNDSELKNKVKAADIKTANFLLLNMGEKNSGGHFISIVSVEETATEIVVVVKENYPSGLATTVMTYPLTIVRINSKKPIRFQ